MFFTNTVKGLLVVIQINISSVEEHPVGFCISEYVRLDEIIAPSADEFTAAVISTQCSRIDPHIGSTDLAAE